MLSFVTRPLHDPLSTSRKNTLLLGWNRNHCGGRADACCSLPRPLCDLCADYMAFGVPSWRVRSPVEGFRPIWRSMLRCTKRSSQFRRTSPRTSPTTTPMRCSPSYPTPYIDLEKRLYSHQEGTVLTNTESAVFPIRRGTKQGDPVSSLLFNTVLQFALEEDLKN